MVKKCQFLIVFSLLISNYAFAEDCSLFWKKLNGLDIKLTLEEKKQKWNAIKPKCTADEFLIGLIRLDLKGLDFDSARTRLNRYLSSTKKPAIDLKLLLIEIDYYETVTPLSPTYDSKLTNSKLETIVSRLLQFIEIHPNWLGGYRTLSTVYIDLGLFAQAKSKAQKSIELAPNSVGYRNVLIAKVAQNDYSDIFPLARNALTLDSTLAGDRDFIVAYAMAMAKQDNLEEAKNALNNLYEHNNTVINDPDVRNIVGYIKSRIAEKQKTTPNP